MTSTSFTRLFSTAASARILPFLVFILWLALDPLSHSLLAAAGMSLDWAYVLRILCAVLLLLGNRHQYQEFRSGPSWYQSLMAVFSGLLIFAIWVFPYPAWLGGGRSSHFSSIHAATFETYFLCTCRWLGSALVVPLIEELFWRSYLMRRLDRVDFLAVSPATVSYYAFVVTAALFAIEHELWFAGLIAGLTYGALYRRYHNLWIPLIAHITTNAVLGAWVVHGKHWQYW